MKKICKNCKEFNNIYVSCCNKLKEDVGCLLWEMKDGVEDKTLIIMHPEDFGCIHFEPSEESEIKNA